jgi:hypothetical protein
MNQMGRRGRFAVRWSHHLQFHDLKATGVTWMGLRGDDALKIKYRAAHKSFSTTEGYIRAAEQVRDAVEAPFPELPETSIEAVKGTAWRAVSPRDLALSRATARDHGGAAGNRIRFGDGRSAASAPAAAPSQAASSQRQGRSRGLCAWRDR